MKRHDRFEICKLAWNVGVVIPPPQSRNKCCCLVAGYAKQFGSNTADRPALIYFEDLTSEGQ